MKKALATARNAILLGSLVMPAAGAAATDPTACVGEIERVCAGMEAKLETCLAERGDQLSAGCRDALNAAMEMAQDPTGPAACIPDIQRYCPELSPTALAKCIAEQKANFGETCQKYLRQNAN